MEKEDRRISVLRTKFCLENKLHRLHNGIDQLLLTNESILFVLIYNNDSSSGSRVGHDHKTLLIIKTSLPFVVRCFLKPVLRPAATVHDDSSLRIALSIPNKNSQYYPHVQVRLPNIFRKTKDRKDLTTLRLLALLLLKISLQIV